MTENGVCVGFVFVYGVLCIVYLCVGVLYLFMVYDV
jgi:hypothetical protein